MATARLTETNFRIGAWFASLSMLSPHFVYPIAETSWYIVISKGAQHFYFNSATKKSVWQIGETGINDLENKVNFDDLAVLFAKSNGVNFDHKNTQSKPPANQNKPSGAINSDESRPTSSVVSGAQEASEEHQELGKHHDSKSHETALSEKENSEIDQVGVHESDSEEKPESTIVPAPSVGLSLGYSSSEEESDEEQENDSDGNDSSDVNSGLDLGLDDEDDALDLGDQKSHHSDQVEEFEAILNQYEDEISKMDPWMLVEEDLLPKFSQHAAFYNVPESSMKERIFNNWVIKRNEVLQEDASTNTFPTCTLRFYRFLQSHKNDVKKMYYVEFERSHKSELDSYQGNRCDLESLYRHLRVTLNDFSVLEKAQKSKQKYSAQSNEKNLKVVHVEKFLAEQDLAKYASNHDVEKLDEDMDYFDQWMQLCNLFSLPESLVHDPRNFILGDEKRVSAYKKVLGSSK